MSVSIWITIVFLKNLRRADDIISGYWYWKIFRIFVSQVRIWQKALWLYTNSIHVNYIYINNKNIQAWHRWFRTTSACLENTVTLYIIDVFIQILEEKYIQNFTMFLVSDMAAFGFWRATAFKVIFITSVIPVDKWGLPYVCMICIYVALNIWHFLKRPLTVAYLFFDHSLLWKSLKKLVWGYEVKKK